jgi:hypothetical protein
MAASIALFLRTRLEFHVKSNKKRSEEVSGEMRLEKGSEESDKLPLLQPFPPKQTEQEAEPGK